MYLHCVFFFVLSAILEREVGDSVFIEQLHELQHKLQFLKAQEFKDAKAVADVQDVIENLKFKVSRKTAAIFL